MLLRPMLRSLPGVRTSAMLLASFALLALGAASARAQAADTPIAPDAPSPATIKVLTFLTPEPTNFTAETPTVDTVNAFLKAQWGYDPDRAWQVEAILKTPVAGVSKVMIAVGQKSNPANAGNLQFFVLPDGKHLIADDVLPFGANPFAENRKELAARADGPSRGATSKDLLFVEFADFQCPHCKEAQANVDKLLQDYPNARFVYENLPLVQIHTEAYKASAYSVCVDQTGGDPAFFKFAAAVFENQAGLTPEGSDQVLKDAAVKAGADPAKIAACSTSPAAKAAVDASLKLAASLGVNSTPTLFANGRGIPLAIDYAKIKEIIDFQLTLDGLKPSTTP